jgi:putative transcriptional regulator
MRAIHSKSDGKGCLNSMAKSKKNATPEVTNCIRRLRFEHGELTQQELADRVGVTRQTIIAIEAGRYLPSLPLAFRLAKAFDVTVEDIFQLNEGDQS